MAVKSDDQVQTPKSTGAVATPAGPVTTEQVADNTSTGAVEYGSDLLGETTVSYGENAEVRVATPTEPVTMTQSWLSDAEAKVVAAPAQPKPKKSAAKPAAK